MDRVRTNPFVNRLKLSTNDRLKLALGAVTIFPFKFSLVLSLLTMASVFGYSTSFLVIALRLKDDSYDQRMKQMFLLIPSFVLKVAFYCTGVRIRVVDESDPEDPNSSLEKGGKVVIAAPHGSHLDGASLTSLAYFSSVSAYKNLFNPFFGSFFFLSDSIFVDRSNPSSREQVGLEIRRRAEIESLLIFPDATTTNRSALLRFKSGAFAPGLPIIPLLISYHSRGSIDLATCTWTGPSSFGLMVMSCCLLSTIRVTITKLPVYYPSAEEILDATLYAQNVRQLCAKRTGLRMSHYSYEDVHLMHVAKKLQCPCSPVCLKLLKICDRILRKNGRYKSLETLPWFADWTRTWTRFGFSHKPSDKLEPTKTNKGDWMGYKLNEIVINGLAEIGSAPSRDIGSINGLVELLVTESERALPSSAVKSDLYEALDIGMGISATTGHLKVALHLCDVRVSSLWERVQNAFDCLAGDEGRLDSDGVRILFWDLLGLEPDQISYDLIDAQPLTMDVIKSNLFKWCPEAVLDNASALVSK